jgi:uncharacterized protein (TIGR00369 family)
VSDAAAVNIAREAANPSPLQQLFGYRLADWGPDRAVVAYEVKPEHLNRTGRLHGGVLASLLDTAMGYAGCFVDEPGGYRACVTLSLTTNFIASVRDGPLTAEARRTGGGRSVFFATAEIRDAAGALVASGTGTFRYVASP